MSIAAAGRYLEEWENKSDAAFVADAFESVVAMFSEIDVVRDDPYWTLTLPWFDEARRKGHMEALAYALLRSAGDKDAAEWVAQHAKQEKKYEDWKQAAKHQTEARAAPRRHSLFRDRHPHAVTSANVQPG